MTKKTKVSFNLNEDLKIKLEKLAAMETIETGRFVSLTEFIIRALIKEYQLNE